MTSTIYPGPGVIGLSPIHGPVGIGVEIGQWLNKDGFKAWEHAYVSLGNGLIVQAEPGGARVAHADDYRVVHWCHGIASLATAEELQDVADAAKGYTHGYGPDGHGGVPYSFLDYDALFVRRLGLGWAVPGLRGYVRSTGHMICSQLADQCYADAGVHLFIDGRWPQDVTPLELYNLDVNITAIRRAQKRP